MRSAATPRRTAAAAASGPGQISAAPVRAARPGVSRQVGGLVLTADAHAVDRPPDGGHQRAVPAGVDQVLLRPRRPRPPAPPS